MTWGTRVPFWRSFETSGICKLAPPPPGPWKTSIGITLFPSIISALSEIMAARIPFCGGSALGSALQTRPILP
jgi:hypothetical protein